MRHETGMLRFGAECRHLFACRIPVFDAEIKRKSKEIHSFVQRHDTIRQSDRQHANITADITNAPNRNISKPDS